MNNTYFLKHLLTEYLQIESAKNYRYFNNIKSCVYFWYFPINLKSKNVSINDALNHYFTEDFRYYNSATKFEISDNRRKVKSTLEILNPSIPRKVEFKFEESEIKNSEKLASFLFATCLFSNPIYIGKANRGDDIKRRLEEHLSKKTDFSKELTKRLEGSSISINDLVIAVIDLEKVEKEYFENEFTTNFDFSEFVEKLLINHFKPVYNIRN